MVHSKEVHERDAAESIRWVLMRSPLVPVGTRVEAKGNVLTITDPGGSVMQATLTMVKDTEGRPIT